MHRFVAAPYWYVYIYLFSLNGGLVVWLPDEVLPGWEGGHSQPRQGQQAQHHQQQHSYSGATTATSHQQWTASHSIITDNSRRSLHELRQQHHSLHSRQLPSTAASFMSFGDNNSLFTGFSNATAGSSQHCHGRQ
jgi:hypothetical protein